MPSSRNGNVLVPDSAVSSKIDDLAWWPDGGAYSENFTVTFNSSSEWILGGPVFSIFAVSDGILGAAPETFLSGSTQYQTPFDVDKGTSIPSKISLLSFLRITTSTGFVESAHLCALSFCVRECYVSVKAGSVSSSVLSTSYSKMAYNDTQPQTSYAFAVGNKSLDFAAPARCDSTYTTESWLDINLQSILQGNINISDDGIESNPIKPNATNEIIYSFNTSTAIPGTMDRVALAMTIHLQDLSNSTLTGQAESTETYIHVEWAWIALPALLVVSGAACLIIAMIETKRCGLHVWKTSEMPFLVHGPDSVGLGAAFINRMTEMEEWATKTEVLLAAGAEDGLLLRRKMI